MESNYDENLWENSFLRALAQGHLDLFHRAIEQHWIICVPCQGNFKDESKVSENDLSSHILVPEKDCESSSTFQTLTGLQIILKNRRLIFQSDGDETLTSRFLFEETFYDDNHSKYTIWCIERPLTQGYQPVEADVVEVSNLRECMNFLWAEVENKDIFHDLEAAIEVFESSHKTIDKENPATQRELVENLYKNSLKTVLSDAKVHEKSSTNCHYHRTVKIAVESYILYGLRNLVPAAVSANTSQQDAELNKTIRNIHELNLQDIKQDLQTIARGKLELSRLDTFLTVLGKIGCLKRAVHYISEGLEPLSSDDLLPILIFIIVGAGLPNWIAQLTFIKQFRFSSDVANDADEVSFLVASLEAALEHVRSGVLTNNKLTLSLTSQENPQDKLLQLGRLFSAIARGDLDEVKRILSQRHYKPPSQLKLCHPLCRCDKCEQSYTENQIEQSAWPSVKSKDERGRTALHIASLIGHVTVVDFLLVHHASPSELDAEGQTPLHCAMSRGHQNTVLLLLHADADPSAPDNRGNSPLHLAADHGHETCAKALLYFSEQMGINVNTNAANILGDTALHYASKWGYKAIVEILLQHGADPRAANRRGQTPMTVAHSHVFRLLEEHLSNQPENILKVPRRRSFEWRKPKTPDEASSPRKTSKADKLVTAINAGDVRLACYYLGLDGPHFLAAEEPPGLCHPLCVCEKCAPAQDALGDRSRVVPLGINAANARGETALHAASGNDLVRLVQILLDAGANVDARTRIELRTPLHVACSNGSVASVKVMLNCPTINVNAKDFLGDTPLHLAVRGGFLKVVEVLLRLGADARCRNSRGVTPLDEIQSLEKNGFHSTEKEEVLKILKLHTISENFASHSDIF